MFVYIGWNSELRNGVLSIYKLEFLPQSGPEVLMSLIIQKNFSWMLSYQKLHVNQALCGILKNVPSQMNAGTLSSSELCLYIYACHSFKSKRYFSINFLCPSMRGQL